ncbi:MAG: DUF2975 domain-containing protein [Limisphaerales bacterium]
MKNFQNKTKIVKVSKILRNIAFAGLVLWAIGIPVVLFHIFTTTPVVTGLTRVGLQGSFILKLMFSFIVNLHLFRFFDRLQNGHLFDAQTIGNLNAAGKWWIVLWLFGILNYEIGREVLSSNAWAWSLGDLFAGMALIFVAWLLKEAQELQEEQELTV